MIRLSNIFKNPGGVSKKRIDLLFLLAVILITLYGSIMVFSAGTAYAETRYGDSLYFVKRQAIWIVLGIAAMVISSSIDLSLYKKYTPHFYIFSLGLLVLVLAVGFVGNGAQRWIAIGPITIQPSEIAKLSMIMMLSYYFSKFETPSTDQKNRKNILIYGTLLPCAIMVAPIDPSMIMQDKCF